MKLTASIALALTLASLPASAAPVELTIFHTNDLHSHMSAPKADEFHLGGLSRMATLLAGLRSQRGTSITLDAGDWSEGSWPYRLDTGANMLRLLDKLGYDAVVVGNHDYLSGPDRLRQTVREAAPRFPVLASNLNFSMYEHAADFQGTITPTAILERGGLKIGIVGLTTVDYTYASFLEPVFATDPLAEARARVAELRPLVDVVIVLSHNAFDSNVAIARAVPGIDAVVSGHSHKKVSRAVVVDNAGHRVPVVETGKWGTFLGDLRLQVDPASKTVEFAGYELHPVLPALVPDPAVDALVLAEEAKLSRLFGSDIHAEVADCETELDDADSHHASLGGLLTQSYRDATGADAALELMALAGVRTPRGALTVETLHDVMPHILDFDTGKEWTIKVLNARAMDLATILGLLYSAPSGDPFGASGQLAMDGIETTWEPKRNQAGNPTGTPNIVSLRIGGQDLDLSRRYRVAMTDGVFMVIGIVNEKYHLGLDLSDTKESGIEGWRAVLAYAAKTRHFTTEGLRAGGKSYSVGADPAVFDYGIERDAQGLRIQVSNEGLAPSTPARLQCSAGTVNDLAAFDTDDAVYTAIGEGAVPALAPGAKAQVRIDWNPGTAGYWPVSCKLVAEVDGYPGNSAARRVFRVE